MYTSGPPEERALLSHRIAATFQLLGVSASIERDTEWYMVHLTPSVAMFEAMHDKAPERYAYNDRSVEWVRREKRTLLTSLGGFWDFFVPLGPADAVQGALVTGPFSRSRPTSAEILERWRWLTGRQGHPSDPEFSHYLSLTLDTLTLEPDNLARYQRWLECFARLVAGQGDAQALAAEATALWQELEGARIVPRIWDASRNMVSESTTRSWLAPHIAQVLPTFGLNAVPEHALVGLIRADPDASDPVDALLRRDGYQRACVELALSRKGVIGGKVGDHGVMFLMAPGAGPARLRAQLHDLAEQAALLARRKFGLSVHFGVSAFRGSKSLPARYDQALAAAEQALAEGRRLVDATPERRSGSSILHIRRQLARASEERPSDLPARFERYLEAVAAASGYRLELCRVHLEAGFDEATRALRSSGAVPDKSYQEMCSELDRAAREAATTRELFAAYRRGVQDVVELAERPVQAGQDRSLRRGIAYAHEHFAEPLSSQKVARVAGLSHPYFCELFKRREKMTFEKYVSGLRIERAKQLLAGTKLSAERVGQLSGFRLRPYFHRVFRQLVGMTPSEYRERALA